MERENYVKITIIGDIMSDATQIEKSLTVGYDCFFENIVNDFKSSVFLIANLETPVSDNTELFSKQEYSFCAPRQLPVALKKLNDNLILLTANNHCLDRGVDGLNETVSILDELKIRHTGTQRVNENLYLTLTAENYKIAVLNYTYGTNAFSNNEYLGKKEQKKVNLLQNQELSNKRYRRFLSSDFFLIKFLRNLCKKAGIMQIEVMPYERVCFSKKKEKAYLRNVVQAKKDNDVVISCLHIGGQYNDVPNKYTRRIIDKSVKADCDIVSANHEHVIHPIKLRDKKFVNYSLGNFIGTNGVTKEPFNKMSDYSIAVNIYINKTDLSDRKYSYSIYKCENEDGLSRVYSLFGLISEYPDREDLKEGLAKITRYLSGKSMPLSKEYFIAEKGE